MVLCMCFKKKREKPRDLKLCTKCNQKALSPAGQIRVNANNQTEKATAFFARFDDTSKIAALALSWPVLQKNMPFLRCNQVRHVIHFLMNAAQHLGMGCT